jgi:heat shock protein HtpX
MAENTLRALQSANKSKTYFLFSSNGCAHTWPRCLCSDDIFGVGTASTMVPMAVAFALIGVWGSYYGSDKLVLTMTGAKLITREDAPELFNVIEEVVIASEVAHEKRKAFHDKCENG